MFPRRIRVVVIVVSTREFMSSWHNCQRIMMVVHFFLSWQSVHCPWCVSRHWQCNLTIWSHVLGICHQKTFHGVPDLIFKGLVDATSIACDLWVHPGGMISNSVFLWNSVFLCDFKLWMLVVLGTVKESIRSILGPWTLAAWGAQTWLIQFAICPLFIQAFGCTLQMSPLQHPLSHGLQSSLVMWLPAASFPWQITCRANFLPFIAQPHVAVHVFDKVVFAVTMVQAPLLTTVLWKDGWKWMFS